MFKKNWGVIKEAIQHFISDRVLSHGAALAYYATFSIGPLLLIVIGVAGFFLSEDVARAQVILEVQILAGDKVAQILDAMLVTQVESNNLMATIVGLVILLFLASHIFIQIKESLNLIWEITPKVSTGLIGFLKNQLFSMSLVLALGFLLVAIVLLSTLISVFSLVIENLIHVPPFIVQSINFTISLCALTFLFAIIFKLLPDGKIHWRDIWAGSFVTTILFIIGEYILSIYLAHQSLTTYGAAGSFVLIMVWIYYSSLIFFFGAEFIQAYARQRGSPIKTVTSSDQANDV